MRIRNWSSASPRTRAPPAGPKRSCIAARARRWPKRWPIWRYFEIGLQTGAHVHIAHSSLARGFALAETFRSMGMQATGEACIQYLCMTEDDLVRLGGRGKCNPPFRTETEVERMWAALAADKIAYVSTDHAPWPLARKTLPDIFACGAGLVGMQSFAALMFTLLDERGLPPTLMATYCAERSARMHGLWPRKGALRVGSDAAAMLPHYRHLLPVIRRAHGKDAVGRLWAGQRRPVQRLHGPQRV